MKKGRNLQGCGIKTVEFTEFAGIRDKTKKNHRICRDVHEKRGECTEFARIRDQTRKNIQNLQGFE